MSATGTGRIICEGWMLKKRRKKMQGFARRYFVLYDSGLLEYSFEPSKPARDQLFLPSAAISSAPSQCYIHLDGDVATFHIKCLSGEDFKKWMAAFRTFTVTNETLQARRSSTTRSAPRFNLASKALDEMGSTLDELDQTVQSLASEEKKHVRHRDELKESVKHGASRFGLFKRGHHSQDNSEASSHHEQPSGSATPSNIQRLQAALDHLRKQHTALVQTLLPPIDTSSVGSGSMMRSPIHEEPGDGSARTPTASTPTTWSRAQGYSHNHWASQSQAFSKRTSVSSTPGGEVWYDALEPEGALEFVIEDMDGATPNDDKSEADVNAMLDAAHANSSRASVTPSPAMSEAGGDDSDEEHDTDTAATSVTDTAPGKEIVRRTKLPSGPVADEGSLFAVLKKNVGKDLASVAMPVTFNEPLTMLQRAAEESEYFELLEQAAQSTDPVERLSYVAAFAVSGYACTKLRSGRKSFNPMLAETFEDVRTKFLAEKVSHQPLIIAYHAEGENWELNATSSGKTKFWGKSLEIIPSGINHVRIGEDYYKWRKPSSFMRNLMMGNKYLEHVGEMVVESTSSKARCVIEFKEAGYWGTPNIIAGTVYDANGKKACQLEGKWDESIARKLDSDHLKVLWRMTPFPKDAREYYGFSAFAVTLNERTPDIEHALPATDSRWRPDVRALEEGNLEMAESEKARVEEAQRERRRAGKDRQARWFEPKGPEDWAYKGGYWEERAQGWQDVDPMW